jgi:hypothetical protein
MHLAPHPSMHLAPHPSMHLAPHPSMHLAPHPSSLALHCATHHLPVSLALHSAVAVALRSTTCASGQTRAA